MRWIKWHLLNLLANLRGMLWRWPSRPRTPAGYSTVSAGLRNWREAQAMYAHGWIPWCVQQARSGSQSLGLSRLFLVAEPAGMNESGAALCSQPQENQDTFTEGD